MSQSILKYVIIPVVLFISSLAIIFWILLPMWNDSQAALAIQKQNQTNLDDRKQLSANLEKLIGQYNERVNDIAFFGKSVPVGENMPELLVGLEALASENNLVFAGANFKPKEFKGGFKTLILEVKLKGSYPALQNYLKAMEKSLRLLDIVAVSFTGVSPGQLQANANNLEFTVTINTYYQ